MNIVLTHAELRILYFATIAGLGVAWFLWAKFWKGNKSGRPWPALACVVGLAMASLSLVLHFEIIVQNVLDNRIRPFSDQFVAFLNFNLVFCCFAIISGALAVVSGGDKTLVGSGCLVVSSSLLLLFFWAVTQAV